MEYNYTVKNIELECGIELLSQVISPIEKTEVVNLDSSLGFILSSDIFAKHNNPPFNRAAVDGYTFKHSNLSLFNIIGEICAGDDNLISVSDGECVRIMTGAAIPDNCDCCVRQEDVTVVNNVLTLNNTAKQYDNYVSIGEDYKTGQLLLPKGTKITFIELGILASAGYYEVPVFTKPKIALISTGDEVVEPYEKLTYSKIFNSNIYLIEGRLKELGVTSIHKLHINDCPETIYTEIKKLSTEYDLIITTGGVSVGKKDIFHDVIQKENMKLVFWRLNIQPGTPIMCSTYNNTPVISLSGNPFASLVNFELVVREALYLLYKDTYFQTIKKVAILKNNFDKKSKNRRFIRAYYENGNVYINTTQHSSGVLSSLRNCNCLIEIKANTPSLAIGDVVNVILL